MYILDTDHLGILQRRRGIEYDRLLNKLGAVSEADIYITIISFHEQFAGWTKFVKGSRESSKIVVGYSQLERLLQDFTQAQVLPFSAAAAEIFDELRTGKVRVATMDLRIAAIAIAQRMVLVTRNHRDFEHIPNLTLDDWTT